MLAYITTPIGLALILQASSNFQPLSAAIGFSLLGYNITSYVIPKVSSSFIKRGLFGKDLSKIGKPVIPETMGVIPAITYLFIMCFFIPFMFYKYLVVETNDFGFSGSVEDSVNSIVKSNLFPHNKLSSFLSGVLCLESMILLGLMDDLFDIRWRHKFFLPAIASIPLLIVYYIDFGVTSILIPNFLKKLLSIEQNSIDVSYFYYCYMGAVAIFCPNSVNILAGVNGLEVGQTVVIAALLLMNDFYYMFASGSLYQPAINSPAYSIHLFSACMLIPFMGVALAMLRFNWFPARAFVGDTWCYFSGMVFAVVGISGHFSKTLMLFFIPQIVNFIYSTPQLFGFVPCPRHRLPKFNPKDGLLYNSMTVYSEFEDKKLHPLFYQIFLVLEKVKLIKLVKEIDPTTKKIIIKESSNLTIINLVLIWTGPLREDSLCSVILFIQFVIGFAMLIFRHTIAPYIFGFDNSWNMLNRFY
ncbi:hypothetical protein B5S28_g2657 [[Candida] boidinii]|nr:hypothetical protein B5S28_g2657 [[Candida] boidinii]OWB60275.1 hypothetical protein B5S29_g1146 [[Candida] boidinii]OWB71230.1 hypothetical protein B5S31_g915 [[Candida] boidinii]OWB77335.1 hypothetical protein B5S32_g1497 [[Candida] boidinii]GMF11673.1 unnamed protein product [[Candida] boidinii]